MSQEHCIRDRIADKWDSLLYVQEQQTSYMRVPLNPEACAQQARFLCFIHIELAAYINGHGWKIAEG